MANTPYFLDRPQLPANFGDLLRGAGLNEGVAFGGSEVDLPDTFTPDQKALALSLARGGGPNISNADIARFLSQTGALPAFPVGGDVGEGGGARGPGASTGPGGGIVAGRGGEPATAGRTADTPAPDAPAFNLGDLNFGDLSGLRGGIAQTINALDSPIGRATLAAASMIPGAGYIPAGINLATQIGKAFGLGNTPDAPTFAGRDEPGFQAQREGERGALGRMSPDDPSIPGAFGDPGDAAANAAANAASDPSGIGPSSADPSGSGPAGPGGAGAGPSGEGPGASGDPGGEGEGGGPGGGGAEGGGDAGGGGDFARGGRVRRGTHPSIGGSWKHAKQYAAGGGVPSAYYQAGGPALPPVSERQARLNRIKAFEMQHGSRAI